MAYDIVVGEKCDRVVQVGNLRYGSNFNNPQGGRVYDMCGVSPTIYDYSRGGGLVAMLLVEYRV